MTTTRNFFSLFLIVLCFSGGAHAFENNSREHEFPLVRHVITNEEGVFLQVGNGWIATEALQATGEGMFVLVGGEWMTIAEALENPECARETWKCEVCGFNNYDGIAACGICGTPRPKKRG